MNGAAPAAAGEKIAEVDGLRAMAILLVLARHGVRPLMPQDGPLLPVFGFDLAVPMLNGWVGVDLFFVLSGFLITRHILSVREHGAQGLGWLPAYLARRALRIVPAYYAVLILVVAGTIPGYRVAPDQLDFRVAYHLLFLQDYLPPDIVVAFWSLGVEEKFYLLAPALIAAALRLRPGAARIGLLVAVAAASPILRGLTLLWAGLPPDYAAFVPLYRFPFHACFEPLLGGVACALILRDIDRMAPAGLRRIGTALVGAGALVLLALGGGREMLGRLGAFEIVVQPSLIGLAFTMLALGVLLGAPQGRWLRARAWKPLATLSYALYLVHMPLIPLGLALADLALGQDAPAPLRFAAFMPIWLALSTAAAMAIHGLVERPFLALKDRVGRVQRVPAATG